MAKKAQTINPPPATSKRPGVSPGPQPKKPPAVIFTPEQIAQGRANQAANREKRLQALAGCTTTYTRLRERFPEHETKILNLSKGSLKAAVALKCVDCSCGQTSEIRDCTAPGCPLWPIRPYRSK